MANLQAFERGDYQQVKADLHRKILDLSLIHIFAEYAVMLAVILVIVIGTVKLIGGNANNVFSQVASSIGQ